MNCEQHFYRKNLYQNQGFPAINQPYPGGYPPYAAAGRPPGYGYGFPGYPPPVQGPGAGFGYGYGLNPLSAGLIGLGIGFLGGQIVGGGPFGGFGKRYVYFY
ncbi:hypothetical protein HP456_16815 [Bacillus haikouensis]|jgi:hypothetical protein|uniref:hypothetical protein n=1 Tax=Bacillus haikouensis TaxID=1510468 RepID=UPI00155354B4|nr:hypothetical protein [Bacillus haikouensis]NQD67577.1 hypothetical protein [Bacillus haikouensis]